MGIPGRPRGRPRQYDRDPVDGLAWYMLDADGFVLPQFREHVAALRRRPDMCELGEVVHAATSRRGDD